MYLQIERVMIVLRCICLSLWIYQLEIVSMCMKIYCLSNTVTTSMAQNQDERTIDYIWDGKIYWDSDDTCNFFRHSFPYEHLFITCIDVLFYVTAWYLKGTKCVQTAICICNTVKRFFFLIRNWYFYDWEASHSQLYRAMHFPPEGNFVCLEHFRCCGKLSWEMGRGCI